MKNGKVLEMYDFHQMQLPEKMLELSVKEEDIQAALAAVTARFLTIQEVFDEVKSKDVVTILMDPVEPDGEQERLQINVGKNFYDAEYEQTLIGASLGERIELPAGKQHRKGTIGQIKRRIYPELTDELIARLELDGVGTIEAYKEYTKEKLIDRAKQNKQGGLVQYVINEIRKKSVFDNLEEEIQKTAEFKEKQIRRLAEEHGKSYEEMLQKVCPANCKTLEQRKESLQKAAQEQAERKALGQALALEKGQSFDENSYQSLVKEYLEQGFLTPEQIEAEFTYEIYEDNAYFEFLANEIWQYYDNQLRVVMI